MCNWDSVRHDVYKPYYAGVAHDCISLTCWWQIRDAICFPLGSTLDQAVVQALFELEEEPYVVELRETDRNA